MLDTMDQQGHRDQMEMMVFKVKLEKEDLMDQKEQEE